MHSSPLRRPRPATKHINPHPGQIAEYKAKCEHSRPQGRGAFQVRLDRMGADAGRVDLN